MQFYNLQYLATFWLVPFLIALFWLASQIKKGRLRRFGDIKTVARMSLASKRNWQIKAVAICLAVSLALFALLRPQWGAEKKKVQRKGVDVVFLLDTSLSMLAADIKPSRIEKAKLEIKSFVKKLKGDRVGLIPFAGSSFLQSPLTLDYSAFFLFLDAVSVGYIPDPGSSIGEALENAIRSFPKGEKKYRVVVVCSDGEFHGEQLNAILKKANQEGVRIYTVGIATKEGEPIPLKAEKGKVVGYKKNRSGEVVISKLNEELLAQIATQTGGRYFPVTSSEHEIDFIYDDMQKLGKREFKEQLVTEREDHYQLFLFLALLFLVFDLFFGDRARKIVANGVSG